MAAVVFSRPEISAATIGTVTESTPPRPGRILVVDDDEMIGTLLRRLLGRENEVHVVHDAQSALSLLQNDANFDVILSDVMLPGMTGTELLAELKTRNAALAERLVFLTGGAFSPEVRAALTAATNPLLEKPFDRAQLKAVVEQFIRRHTP
jgi:CheY-like chemotaxis protein